MANFDDVSRIVSDMPEVSEREQRGNRTWCVAGKPFAWERPFTQADLRRFGAAAPPVGPILAVRVGDLGDKEAVLAANPAAFFTIPHFDGYSAILIQIGAVEGRALTEALLDGWLASAPAKLAARYLSENFRPPSRQCGGPDSGIELRRSDTP